MSAIGRDALGDDLMTLMGQRGVRTEAVQRLDGRRTRDVLVTRKEGGDRVFAGFGGDTADYADW